MRALLRRIQKQCLIGTVPISAWIGVSILTSRLTVWLYFQPCERFYRHRKRIFSSTCSAIKRASPSRVLFIWSAIQLSCNVHAYEVVIVMLNSSFSISRKKVPLYCKYVYSPFTSLRGVLFNECNHESMRPAITSSLAIWLSHIVARLISFLRNICLYRAMWSLFIYRYLHVTLYFSTRLPIDLRSWVFLLYYRTWQTI